MHGSQTKLKVRGSLKENESNKSMIYSAILTNIDLDNDCPKKKIMNNNPVIIFMSRGLLHAETIAQN